jgi:hypothetical protein
MERHVAYFVRALLVSAPVQERRRDRECESPADAGETRRRAEAIARELGLGTHRRQLAETAERLWGWPDGICALVAGGKRVALVCGCSGAVSGAPCHHRATCEYEWARTATRPTGVPGSPYRRATRSAAAAAPAEPSVGFYALDLASAYRFVVLQWLDLWCHCFLWLDGAGHIGMCTDTRLCFGFGGAYGPNRFERIATMMSAYILRCIAEFDATAPPPRVAEWAAERSALQAQGLLPP